LPAGLRCDGSGTLRRLWPGQMCARRVAGAPYCSGEWQQTVEASQQQRFRFAPSMSLIPSIVLQNAAGFSRRGWVEALGQFEAFSVENM